jgi:hypothetical protein
VDQIPDFASLEPRVYPPKDTPPLQIGDAFFRLREADMPTEDAYRAESLRGVTVTSDDDSGKRQIGGIGRITLATYTLIGGCLFRCNRDGTFAEVSPETKQPVAVGANFVRAANWPARLRKFLFAKAKEISELDEKETPEEVEKEIERLKKRLERMRGPGGNEQSATELSSS